MNWKPKSQTDKRIDKAMNSGGGAKLYGQIQFTAGRAYYNGEEYVLQRGNNRRIVAVSRNGRCSIIETPFHASEADAEIAAATAILKGLDSKADLEVTYDVKANESKLCCFNLDKFDGAMVDWGDGTVEPLASQRAYHTYSEAGRYIQKIAAPNATTVKSISIPEDSIVYIGGGISKVNANGSYPKMVIWGENIKSFRSPNDWGHTKEFDFPVPPFVEQLAAGWDCKENYVYIPSSCTSIRSMQSDGLEFIEIEPKGSTMELKTYALFSHSSTSNTRGRRLQAISIPARCDVANVGSSMDFASGRSLKFIRFESGITALPSGFMQQANYNYITKKDSMMYVYIPKTMTNIPLDSVQEPVHFVYEGTYTEWLNVEGYGENWADMVSSSNRLKLSCSGYSADSGRRYESFENDVKNTNSEGGEYVGGNGIEIDETGGTINVKLAENSPGLRFSSLEKGLEVVPANAERPGALTSESSDLRTAAGFLSFLGMFSGVFYIDNNTSDVVTIDLGDKSGVTDTDLIVAIWYNSKPASINNPKQFAVAVTPFLIANEKNIIQDYRPILKFGEYGENIPINQMFISKTDGEGEDMKNGTFLKFVLPAVRDYDYTQNINWFIIKRSIVKIGT